MKTNNPKLSLILFFMLLGLFLLQTQLVLAEITLNDEPGTEFIINQAPEYTGQTQSTTNTIVSQNTILATNIYIQTAAKVQAISCHFSSSIISITNTNDEPITTVISSNKDYVSFNKYSTFVMPGSTNEIIMYVNAPCAEEFNTKQTLTFTSDNIVQELTQELIITQVSNIAGTFSNTYATACPAENLRYTATITNPAPFSDTYTITADNYGKYTTILPKTFVLGAGDSQDITIITTLPKEEYGNKTIPVSIETKNNKYKSEVELAADIDQCYNFAVSGPETIFVCEDGFVKNTSYSITNYAAFSNAYDLSLENKPSFMQIGGEYIELQSNQSGIIPVSLEPETKTYFRFFEQSRAGNYTTTLVAESIAGDVIAEKDITVIVGACYDHNFETTSKSFEICSGDEGIPFNIKNNGLYEETYQLSLSSSDPAGVYLQNEYITINSNNASNEILYINQANLSDNAQVTLYATVANNSKVSESVDITLDRVSDKTCYAVKITPRKINIDTQENISEYIVPITVLNNGIRNSNYSIYLDNTSDFVQINATHVYLLSGEAKDLNLTATITNNTKNGAAVFITAETNGYADTTRVKVYYDTTFPWWFLLLILFLIILLLLVGVISKSRNKKNTTKSTRDAKVSKLSKNKSKEEKRKDKKEKKKSGLWWILLLLLWLIAILFVLAFLLDSNDESTTGTNETNQTTLNNTIPVINETNTTGNQTSSHSVLTQIGEWFLGLFPKANATTQEPVNNTTEPNVNETNQTENEQTQENTSIIVSENTTANESTQVRSPTFLEHVANWFNSLFTTLNTTGIVNESNTTIQENETIVQEISACPEVADMKAFIESNNLTNDFTYQIIPRNAIVEIDLSELFIDPDNDTLTYSLEETDNITVTVLDSTGYIIPDEDFCGVRTTRIIAIDPDGATATSPEITLIIEEKASISTYFLSMKGITILATILIISMIVATIIWIKE